MAMSYHRRSVFINGNSFVSSLCLLLAIFGSFAVGVANADLDAGQQSLTLTTPISDTSTSQIIPKRVSNSCANWENEPVAADGNCSRLAQPGLIRCHGGMNNLQRLNSKHGKLLPVRQLLLCGLPQAAFNRLGELQRFPQLRSLTIEYGDFTELTFDFPEMFHLQAINISWTNLTHISSRTFKRLHTLKILDLRWNQLIQLEGPLILPHTFQQLYLAGNPWNCTRNFKWLLLQPDKGRLVADRDELICTDGKYKELQMMLVMHYKVTVRKECESHEELRNCTCLMTYMHKTYTPHYTIICSNLQFNRLPSYLPVNTSSLYINDNLISDVSPLRDNPHYRDVVDMQLSNNRISSIDILEDTYWLQNFRMLNLHGNLLRKFQVYALDNALEDNPHGARLLFSKNPWHCTCKFGMRLRQLLTKYIDIVPDAYNVTCTYSNGDELRHAKVLSLTREDMCNVDPVDEWFMHPIDLLNCIFASLILLILGKLGYDYYFYRYHGKVPWIVLKMP
ncbi:protein singed wings 2 isoform X1 [Drosophila sulfurigaster albostrigata]|uniref:protein singed wings 2 isoform X1 n=1 Tax=Drosophila sulfurigaster albostrigata TaxID=89887 RepID=UPI002D21D50C|nr:protein singed wings 2 isoform X1 [Drosophila sulfurigaster albostrigata]